MNATPPVLLAATAAALAWSMRRPRARYAQFASITDPQRRIASFRRIAGRHMTWFALPSLVGLALLHELGSLIVMPAAFGPAAAWLPLLPPGYIAACFVVGVVLGSLVAWALYRWRGPRTGRRHLLGDAAALVPRTRKELPWGALVSLTAGVCEELMFRLFLPLLLVIVTESATAAFVVATLLFGAMHLYQGRIGVIATTIVGIVLAALYLATRTLWLAMAFHVLIDMAALVAHPLQRGMWRLSALAATRS